MTPRREPRLQPEGALALSLQRREWERAALCLLVATAMVVRRMPQDGIDELIALLAGEEEQRDAR